MKVAVVISPKFTGMAVPRDTRGMFQSRMMAALKEVISDVMEDIMYATQSRNARENYRWPISLAGDAVQAQVWNDWPYWIFQEENTGNYSNMPPFQEGTRLYDYIMNQKPGYDPNPFLAARAIFNRGTIGKYTFTDHWHYALPMIEARLAYAAQQFVAEASGFTGGME